MGNFDSADSVNCGQADVVGVKQGNPIILGKLKDGPKRFTATLPLPPSINGAYMPNKRMTEQQRGIRTSDEVAFWKDVAKLELRKQGWAPCPKGKYSVLLRFDVYTWRSDIDKGDKFAIDAACKALGINDYWVQERLTVKHTSGKDNERIEICADVVPR